MPILPPGGEAPLTYTVGDIIADAFIEIGAWSPGEVVNSNPDEAQWGLRKLNYLVDAWQALGRYVWGYAFNLYTLTAQLSPHLIGPDPSASNTFFTPGVPRPVKLESGAQLLNAGVAGGPVDQIIDVSRDRAWWARQQTKNIQTNVVTDCFYDPTFPNGSLYFWPVPNAQVQVRLQFWQTVSQFPQITDPIGGPGGPGTLPQAYRAALMLTLAEQLLPGAKREAHGELTRAALMARTAIFGNNAKSPRMATQDSGMPKAGRKSGTRGDFNWATGGAAGGAPE
jgi:hypothetical protein